MRRSSCLGICTLLEVDAGVNLYPLDLKVFNKVSVVDHQKPQYWRRGPGRWLSRLLQSALGLVLGAPALHVIPIR